MAQVLCGDAEPRGRLPVSVPRSAAQLPVYYNGKDHRYRGVHWLSGGTSWPRVRERRGFVRLCVAPGDEAEAVFEVGPDTPASVGRDLRLAVAPGVVELETGPASDRTADVRLEITDSESNVT